MTQSTGTVGENVIPKIGEPSELTAEWMTARLEEAGIAKGAKITSLEFKGFIGTGQMGRNARFVLQWDNPEGKPQSVVGKFPTDDLTTKTTSFEGGAYLKEVDFYRSIKPTVKIRTPEVYVNLYDPASLDFALIMEDMSGSEQGDQFRGLTADEAALAIEQAVLLHAPRWGDPALSQLSDTSPEETALRLGEIYKMTCEPALAQLAPHLDDLSVKVAQDLLPLVAKWTNAITTPETLIHIDFRPDNFLFGKTPEAPPLAVVDWQTYRNGAAMNDIAYMIGGAFLPEVRPTVERDLITEYCARMKTEGVDYSFDTAWHDYRIASLWGVIMSVIAAILAARTERGDKMLGTMLLRAAHHAHDIDALDLLK